MKSLPKGEQKLDRIKYEHYKRLIRNLRRGKVEKPSDTRVGDNLTKESRSQNNRI